jgi:hypothetical protein
VNKIPKNTNLEKHGHKGGRPKGALNKTTQIAKDAIALAADELGGAKRLVDWAKEEPQNERAFWTTIYPKLLPLQVHGTGDDGEFVNKVIVEYVKANAE